jgi:AcrR family transcriptional regulator
MPVLGKSKKDVISEFRCSEILDAARAVFARKGFKDATVDDIAEAAGVAKGTVYLYFASKRDIFLKTVIQGTIALQDEVRRSMAAEPDAATKIQAFIRTRLEYSERNRDFMRIFYLEMNHMLIRPVPGDQEFQELYQRQAATLERILEEGIARNEVRTMDVSASARVIYDMTRGLVVHRLLGWSESSVEQDAGFLFDVIWKGVGCHEG